MRRPGEKVEGSLGWINPLLPPESSCRTTLISGSGEFYPLPAVNSSLPYRAPSLRQIALYMHLKDHYTTVGVYDQHH